MQLRSELQLISMLKSMKDVIIPAVDAKNDLAVQQAHLIVGMLTLMTHQLPIQFSFDRDELKRLLAFADGLAALSSDDAAIDAAVKALDASRAAAGAIYERCATDPAELSAAVREMRSVTSALMTASSDGRDKAALEKVEKAVLALSREQLLRDRSLMLPQGWEPDPSIIPPILQLLNTEA